METHGFNPWLAHASPIAIVRLQLDVGDYEREFGTPSEGEEAMVMARVSLAAKRALEREAQRTGETQAAVVERLLMTLADE